MDAFVKAAREHFNDESIGTKELFKLMENGELLSKDILPLVGKHMAAAAKKGGALEKMLVSNGVAMRRLTQTWQNFQNEFFKGGFGTALTDTFNTLAQMLKDNTGLAKMMGAALGAVMNNLLDGFTMVYDLALLFWLDMDYYLFQHIPQGMKDFIADWAAIGAAIVIATGLFRGLYGIIKMIFGLGSLSKSLGIDGLGGKDGKKGGGKGAKLFGAALASTFVYPMVEAGMDELFGDTAFGQWAKNTTLSDLVPTFTPSPNMTPLGMAPSPYAGQTSNWAGAASYGPQQDINLNIKVDEGILKDVIKVEIKDEQQKILNQIYQE